VKTILIQTILVAEAAKLLGYVIAEVLSTEEMYQKQLSILLKVLEATPPLLDITLHGHHLKEMIGKIKGLSQNILSNLNAAAKKTDLTERSQGIVDFFNTLSTDGFIVYQTYASNYNEMMLKRTASEQTIAQDERRKNELSKILQSEGNTLDLASLLITPIQRLPRYRMLLEVIEKSLEDKSKKTEAAAAALKIKFLCDSTNKMYAEEARNIIWLFLNDPSIEKRRCLSKRDIEYLKVLIRQFDHRDTEQKQKTEAEVIEKALFLANRVRLLTDDARAKSMHPFQEVFNLESTIIKKTEAASSYKDQQAMARLAYGNPSMRKTLGIDEDYIKRMHHAFGLLELSVTMKGVDVEKLIEQTRDFVETKILEMTQAAQSLKDLQQSKRPSLRKTASQPVVQATSFVKTTLRRGQSATSSSTTPPSILEQIIALGKKIEQAKEAHLSVEPACPPQEPLLFNTHPHISEQRPPPPEIPRSPRSPRSR